jgi:ABC-type Fe3+ transport system permease subunit
MDNFSEMKKWLVILVVALVFALVSSPMTYKLVNSLTKKVNFPISTDEGLPNYWGQLIHTIVFAVILRLLMLIKY